MTKKGDWFVVFDAMMTVPDKPGIVDETAMFETLAEAKDYYEIRRKMENCHSAGIARLLDGTDWM